MPDMSYLDIAKQARARLRAEGLAREKGGKGEEAPRHVDEALPFLGMPLDVFASAEACLEVRVPWLRVTLWIAPDERHAEQLFLDGIARGRVWTASELINLMSVQSLTPHALKTIALAKLEMGGDIVSVRRLQ
jgi:hypothetical protein